jgi:uridine kinase
LSPTGIRGLVIECEDCHEPHYFDWDLLRGNLRHLLTSGRPRVHEPAYDPTRHYVTWEYAAATPTASTTPSRGHETR